MKLSVSSYSFMGYIRRGLMTQADALTRAREMGFRAVEFTDLCPEHGKTPTPDEQKTMAAALREEAERTGMTINAYTIGANLFRTGDAAEAEIARLCGQLDVAALMGAKILRHDMCWSLGTGKYHSFDAMLPTLAANARRVTEYAQTLGIRTCTENHGYIAQDSDRVERMYNAVGHENYGLLVDIGNFACVDEDSAAAVSRVAPYAVHVHAKDFIRHPWNEHSTAGFETRGCSRLEGCAIGDGDIPVGQCLAILRRAGYDGFVSVEYEGASDCIEGIQKGMDTLLSLGVEL